MWLFVLNATPDAAYHSPFDRPPACFSFDLANRSETEQRDTRLIDSAMIELHQLDFVPVTTRYLLTPKLEFRHTKSII